MSARGQGVRVKARTNLWVELSEPEGVLRGYLADDSGERLARRRLSITSEDAMVQAVTGDEGDFEVTFPLGLKTQTIQVSFSGDPYHEASTLSRQLDPSRLPVVLQLVIPTVVSLDEQRVEAQVHAEHDGRPVQIEVELEAPMLASSLGRGRTGEEGWVSIAFDPRSLGRAGVHHVHARFDGDESLGPALAIAEVLFVETTTLTLTSTPDVVLPDERVRLRGTLIGTFGPLPGQEVTLESGGAPLAHAMTKSAGVFDAALDGLSFPGMGTYKVIAHYRSSVKTRRSSESPPVSVTVREPQPLAWELVVGPAVVTALLFVIILIATRRREPSEEGLVSRVSKLPIETGFRPSQLPSMTIRRNEYFDLTGTVSDPVENRPVAGAVVKISAHEPGETTSTDEKGRFRLGPLSQGTHAVIVSAPGYLSEPFTVTIPHSGAYHGTRVSIMQIRHKALEIYRAVARPLLPRQGVWGRWTPREVAVHTVRSYPWLSDEISELTSFFEELYYSPTVNVPNDLDRLTTLASSVVTTQRERSSASTPDG